MINCCREHYAHVTTKHILTCPCPWRASGFAFPRLSRFQPAPRTFDGAMNSTRLGGVLANRQTLTQHLTNNRKYNSTKAYRARLLDHNLPVCITPRLFKGISDAHTKWCTSCNIASLAMTKILKTATARCVQGKKKLKRPAKHALQAVLQPARHKTAA